MSRPLTSVQESRIGHADYSDMLAIILERFAKLEAKFEQSAINNSILAEVRSIKSERSSPIAQIKPPARSLKRRKPIPKRVRIILSLHPKKAAIARFDARIGKAAPQITTTDSASTARKESSVTQPTDVRDVFSTQTGKCLFTLLRPSGEASPLDAITRHLVWLASLT